MTLLSPTANRVLVQLQTEVYEGALVLPDQVRVPPTRGLVLAVGPGIDLLGGSVRPVAVSVGDAVLFTADAGEDVPVSLSPPGERHRILLDTEILLRLVDAP